MGLIDEEVIDQVTPAMLPLPVPQTDFTQTKEDHWIMDPLDEDTLTRWNNTAATNTKAFREVFRCVPDDTSKYIQYALSFFLFFFFFAHSSILFLVETWSQYHKFYPDPNKIDLGHVYDPYMSVQQVRGHLDTVRGHLVEFPTKFLSLENLQSEAIPIVDAAVQELYT